MSAYNFQIPVTPVANKLDQKNYQLTKAAIDRIEDKLRGAEFNEDDEIVITTRGLWSTNIIDTIKSLYAAKGWYVTTSQDEIKNNTTYTFVQD